MRTEEPIAAGGEDRTEKVHLEFSPSFVKWITALAGATLILVYFHISIPGILSTGHLWDIQVETVTSIPWIAAAGHTISQGISEFSTGNSDPPGRELRTSALGGALFLFIVAPTLALFGWRDHYLKKPRGEFQTINIFFGL